MAFPNSIFLNEYIRILISYFCSWWLNKQYSGIGSYYDLTVTRRQTIIGTNVVHWRGWGGGGGGVGGGGGWWWGGGGGGGWGGGGGGGGGDRTSVAAATIVSMAAAKKAQQNVFALYHSYNRTILLGFIWILDFHFKIVLVLRRRYLIHIRCNNGKRKMLPWRWLHHFHFQHWRWLHALMTMVTLFRAGNFWHTQPIPCRQICL